MVSSEEPRVLRAVDPRPARTRAEILAAIERLGATGEDLTVAAIVAEAQVSRSSFYAQFRDLDDLAVQVMEEILREIRLIEANLRGANDALGATTTALQMFLGECQRRRGLYAAVLGGNVSGEALQRIHSALSENVMAAAQYSAPRSVDPVVASSFVAAGTLAVIIDWLLAENPLPAGQLHSQLMGVLPTWVTRSTLHDRLIPETAVAP